LLIGALVTAIGQMVGGVSVKAAEAVRTFPVRGIVQSPYADGTVSIAHEEIRGFMPAMTMPFYVDEAEGRGLERGDIVEFDFVVGETSRATKFRKVGRAATAAAANDR